MPEFLLIIVIALVVAALVFGVAAILSGSDKGLSRVEPDGASRGLPAHRPLVEEDLSALRFDTGLRGYRMSQVDAALARTAYDLGFKQEMIEALHAEVDALRDGRFEDAEILREARDAAVGGTADDEPGTGRHAARPASAGRPPGHGQALQIEPHLGTAGDVAAAPARPGERAPAPLSSAESAPASPPSEAQDPSGPDGVPRERTGHESVPSE